MSLDCGSRQTFTCSVIGPAAVWTISDLSGISVVSNNGQSAANNSPRITTTDTSGVTQSSTIIITGFNTADNGGTIQCNNLDDNSVTEYQFTVIPNNSCGSHILLGILRMD